MPFLTQIDPNARIKGSRDPLGVQAIWTALGRRVVSNLTTVSTSVRDFTATMLGYALVERLENSAESEVELFLRWEQWAAYSRAFHFQKEAALRGIERVRERLEESTRVTISAARQHQILSNQKTYGLWGLYSMPARDSGLIEMQTARLTPEARALVEAEYWPKVRKIADFLPKQKCPVDLQSERLVKTIATLLGPRFTTTEREFYTRHLLHRTPQQTEAVRTMPAELRQRRPALSPVLLRDWQRRAEPSDPALAADLEHIRVAESVLAPAVWLFSWLLGQEKRTLDAVVKDVRDQWGTAFERLELETFRGLGGCISQAAGRREGSDAHWMTVAASLHAADYTAAVRALLDLSADVMQHRGGARWISLENDSLRVHAQEKPARLLEREELPQLWTHSYFLDSLAIVTETLTA